MPSHDEAAVEDFSELLFLYHTRKDPLERQKILAKAQSIAQSLSQLHRWPLDPNQFWDAEALHWNLFISSSVRENIHRILLPYSTGVNLMLGSGSQAYGINTICVDFSIPMLMQCPSSLKIQYDLEANSLPFQSGSINAVFCIFLINYLRNLEGFLAAVKRVLAPKGSFVIINSDTLADYYLMQQAPRYDPAQVQNSLDRQGFSVKNQTISLDAHTLHVWSGKKNNP